MSSAWHLRQACRCLDSGGVIAYPTEAIYGLGCDPLDLSAVERLLQLKQRSWRKGLILIAADFAQVQPFLEPIAADMFAKIQQSWPGPVTWLMPALPEVPLLLRGDSDKLAVRVTAHAQTAQLCEQWGGAIVSTSANISDRPAAKNPQQVRRYFGSQLDYILGGELGGRDRPSEIRDVISDRVLR